MRFGAALGAAAGRTSSASPARSPCDLSISPSATTRAAPQNLCRGRPQAATEPDLFLAIRPSGPLNFAVALWSPADVVERARTRARTLTTTRLLYSGGYGHSAPPPRPSCGTRCAALPGCLLYTSDAADDLLCVDLGGRRII